MNSLTRAPVVVGVDGSPESRAAVYFAAWEADRRRLPLRLVHADRPTAGDQADADGALVEAVAGWAEKYPEVEVVRRAVYGTNPVRTLIEESAGAELVVVGGYGRVGDGLVHHARVPVAVVPEPVVPDAG